MNKDYLSDVYRDFFNSPIVENNSLENIEQLSDSKFDINKIDSLMLNEESLELLKKVIYYMKDYDKNKEYIDFHLIIEGDNKEIISSFENIIEEVIKDTHYVSSGKSFLSFYEIDTIDKIKDIFKNSFIIIRDIKGLSLKDENYKKTFFHYLEENLHHKIILLEGISSDIKYFFEFDNTLRERAFPFTFSCKKLDVNDVYLDVLDRVKCSREDSFSIEILDYITKTYEKSRIDYPSYRDALCREIEFHHRVPLLKSEKSLDEIFKELNELVGLDKIKKTLHELVDYMTLSSKTDSLNLKNINLHMVFLGNPGTGKTTVARIVADILYQLKYIRENKLIEVTSKDLVAEYVGQTAPKTMGVIERSLGGVLFIDEAYSLASKGNQNSYNAEAIATLIKAMEDYRDDLVVIFAGYTKEMQDFLDSNSGIVSRIGYTLEFDDYTEDELVEIFKGMATKAGFIVEEDSYLRLREIIRENKDTKNFGNARFIRNVFEKTIIKHAANTRDKKRKSVLITIKKEDISYE